MTAAAGHSGTVARAFTPTRREERRTRQRMTAAAEHSDTIPHAAAVSADELDVPDVIDDAHISRTRASMMAALADAVTAHELAADHLGSLRGPLCDLDLSDSRDGHDLAAHIDTAIRCGRAAYAVLHAITTA